MRAYVLAGARGFWLVAASAAASTAAAAGATAAPTATATSWLRDLRQLLAARGRFGAPLLLGTRAGEEVEHRVVPFVAAVLEVAVALLARDRHPHGPYPGVDLGVVD